MTDQKLFSLNDIYKIIRWAEEEADDKDLKQAFVWVRIYAQKYYFCKIDGIEAEEELKELAI